GALLLTIFTWVLLRRMKPQRRLISGWGFVVLFLTSYERLASAVSESFVGLLFHIAVVNDRGSDSGVDVDGQLGIVMVEVLAVAFAETRVTSFVDRRVFWQVDVVFSDAAIDGDRAVLFHIIEAFGMGEIQGERTN